MNFSDHWRSLWPVASVSHAPNLLSGDQAATLGPLLFHPSPPCHTLFASSSLALRIPPSSPPPILDDIQSFFRCPTNGSFLPTTDQFYLAADIQSSLVSAYSNSLDPLSCNSLHALPCHDGFSVLLFFPTGDNADEIGFVCLRFRDECLKPEVGVDLGGDIFKQREGLKHPRHRILKLSVVSSPTYSSSPTDTSITEGFLMATTLYSVNWFRVETRSTDVGMLKPLLMPLAKQGFSSCVVDACWSQHFLEESAVLLETGELCWFNLVTKRGGTHRIELGDNSDTKWLGCKFGGQPWVILAASSINVVLVDLRPKRINELPKVLASVKLPDFLGVVSMKEKDTFQAFCRANFNDFHFTAVTERLLILFDVRQPLVPILTWDHGLEHPTYVSMFRLSELRTSEEFKSVSELGFVILVGSFWKNEFKIFCYGPSDKGAIGSSFFAWQLPSLLSLSGKHCSSIDDLVRKMMSKENHPNQDMLLRNEGIAGFCIVRPNILLKCRSEPGVFVLIRLTLSGRLEIQKYHSSSDSENENRIWQGIDLQETKDFTIYNTHEGNKVSSRFYFLKLCYLSKYMNGNLSDMLIERYLELNGKGSKNEIFTDDLIELLSCKLQSSSSSISSLIADVSIPTNVFEVVSRRILTTLKPEFLSLTFTKYEELLIGHADTTFLPLEFPKCLPHHRFPPFFVNIPSRRSEFLPSTVLAADAIVGPLLPLPVLLVLQQKGMGCTEFSNEEELDDDLLNLECKRVLEFMFPETSIADSYDFSGLRVSQVFQDDEQFFVYRPTLGVCKSVFNDASISFPNEKTQSQIDYLSENYVVAKDTPNDEKFTTFVCGNFDKKYPLDCGSEVNDSEIFDASPVKLDFESFDVMLQPTEILFLNSLKRQASKWLENNKSYQDFCTSSKISDVIL
ncbi:uncharacterized protein LOC110095321 isoform X1 [Dendrobium catenatum]|uniref:Uncharacterized protein n=1 Tax=Dendrobium catenatum TaxID=906689 RepID=A0A2I0WYD7_9ASPA|nr:uncharacterized protein LOC110095321 isoform X1 [Dendrobium catenatum]PKU80673.1 hypothetical protein MA16_Dca012431 [Dendrobium catenatum]